MVIDTLPATVGRSEYAVPLAVAGVLFPPVPHAAPQARSFQRRSAGGKPSCHTLVIPPLFVARLCHVESRDIGQVLVSIEHRIDAFVPLGTLELGLSRLHNLPGFRSERAVEDLHRDV